MAIENIDGTASGDGPFNVSVPALTADADIQQALRVYHYGSTQPPANLGAVAAKSVAGYFKSISERVQLVESAGIGSSYSQTEPESPPNGFLWVDADSSSPIFDDLLETVPSVAKYQNSQPTTNLKDGMLWVDKDSTPLKMYVYDLLSTTWKEIGA
jgi:hypothetical protein